MKNDNKNYAVNEAKNFDDLNVIHYWDNGRQLGDMYSKTLSLKSTAWDVYFLYAKGVLWEDTDPPEPAFWIHQLPASMGADRDRILHPILFSDKLLKLLGHDDKEVRTHYSDLGFEAHARALAGLTKKGSCHSMEDILNVFKKSGEKP